MKEPVISISCTTYNHEKYIRQCLDGFVSQITEYPFEVLIHDDASTDHTADIIREYEKKYPTIIFPIYQRENQYSKGVPITKKYQFPRARGKYIAFCEGDDYWSDSKKLQKQISFLEEHPEYSSSVHNVLTVDKDDKPLYETSFGNYDHDIEIDGTLQFPQTSSYVIKNPLLNQSEEGKEIANAMFGADKSYVLYMKKTGKTRLFSDCMSHYRLVTDFGDSHSARKARTNMTEHWIKNELSLYHQVETYNLDIDISYHVFQNMCAYPLMFFIRHPGYRNFSLFIKAVTKFPYSKRKLIKTAISYMNHKIRKR